MNVGRLLTYKGLSVLVLLGSLYVLGYATAHYDLFPSPYIRKAYRLAASGIRSLAGRNETTQALSISTIFITLNVDILDVPVSRAGQGGGLTSAGNELLQL